MWLKIKVWTKITVAAALVLYVLLFIYNNNDQKVTFWWWFNQRPQATVFTLALLAFIAGMIATIVVSTSIKTVLQFRQIRRRNQQERSARELADLRSKASMLKTRDSIAAGLTASSPSSPSSSTSPASSLAASTLDEPAV